MKIAIDSSVLVGFYLQEDTFHNQAVELFDAIINEEVSYACTSLVNVAEMGYVLERATNDELYAVNCIKSILEDLPIEIIPFEKKFAIKLAHFKAQNAISFCDNATITAANMTESSAVFTKEKEVVDKIDDLIGAEILFLEDMAVSL